MRWLHIPPVILLLVDHAAATHLSVGTAVHIYEITVQSSMDSFMSAQLPLWAGWPSYLIPEDCFEMVPLGDSSPALVTLAGAVPPSHLSVPGSWSVLVHTVHKYHYHMQLASFQKLKIHLYKHQQYLMWGPCLKGRTFVFEGGKIAWHFLQANNQNI